MENPPSPIERPDRRNLFRVLPAVAAAGLLAPGLAQADDDQAPGLLPPAAPDPLRVPATPPPFAHRVLCRMGFGPRPGDVDAFMALGASDAARLQAYVEQQLNPGSIDDSALAARLGPAQGYTTLQKSLTTLWADHVISGGNNSGIRLRPILETERAAFVRAVHSRRQLVEVLADFWHNHFNVFGYHWDAGPVFVHYDRDVIRANLLGNFRTMLEDVAKSTSMLYYLDNRASTNAGPNENFARELLELHTLGAEHYLGVMNPFDVPRDDEGLPIGYVDVDVYEATRAFTGWTVRNGHWQFPNENDGTFVYRAAWHDRFNKFFLGLYLPPDQPALRDGRQVLDALASHPATARHVCAKLVRRLVGDSPEPALVASTAQLFRATWQAPDQLRQVTRHILLSEAFRSRWGDKTRRPFEAVVAALRAGGSDYTLRPDGDAASGFMWRYGATGHRPYGWAPPNGYPDTAAAWQGSNALGMGWRMLAWLTEARDGASGPWLLDVHQQTLTMIPSAGQRTARRLVEVWTQRLLGAAATGALRDQLEAFMAQNANPATEALDIASDSWAGNNLKLHYIRSRLRCMVGMILCSPAFLNR